MPIQQNSITISEYLLLRLNELNIKHIFGVPGDYNLRLLDYLLEDENTEWIGTCNELNAAYAADGYARTNGVGAVITTFGVGELSAINGIAGSYAEYVPVVKITGMPKTTTQKNKLLVHHTLGNGDFDVFRKMYSNVTATTTVISAENAAEEIDRVLKHCWLKKRPVYIGLPMDIVDTQIKAPKEKLCLEYPKSNACAVNESIARIAQSIKKASKPVILIDVCTLRHSMEGLLHKLIEQTNIPVAAMLMGKGVINESHSSYLGMYCGSIGDIGVTEYIESADYVLTFGTFMSELNTGGFTIKLNVDVMSEIHSDCVIVGYSVYNDVYFTDTIPQLIENLENYRFTQALPSFPGNIKKETFTHSESLSQAYFWTKIQNMLKPNVTILADIGTSLFASLNLTLPDQTRYITQPSWGSIGYSVAALLGTCIAQPNREAILFEGDGSFQLTAQEISTLIRHKLNPIVFLLNNDGYTIERIIHGEKKQYNDIAQWDYAKLPHVFGDNVWSAKVSSEEELDNALSQLDAHASKLRFIEVVLPRMDHPKILKQLVDLLMSKNAH